MAIRRFKDQNSFEKLRRSVRSKALSTRAEREIVKKNPGKPTFIPPKDYQPTQNDSPSKDEETVSRGKIIYMVVWQGKISSFLQSTPKNALTSQKKHLSKNMRFREGVIFSDESKFNIFGSDGWRLL